MSVSREIDRHRTVLLGLADALGISQDRLSANENADQIIAQASVPPDRIDPARLDGSPAQLRFTLPQQPPVIITPASHDRAALEKLLETARNSGVDVDINLELEKKTLEQNVTDVLRSEGAARLDELRIAVLFFGGALERILSNAEAAHYRFFEERFLKANGPASPDRLLLILVADSQSEMYGPYLAILGRDCLDKAAEFLAAAGSFEILRVARKLMGDECIWDRRAWLLTPDFFSLQVDDSGDLQGCRSNLRRLQNQLSLPYLANSTSGEPKALDAKFEGNRTLRIDVEDSSAEPFRFYQWAYRDPEPALSKLTIVRRVVASRLPSATNTLKELTAHIPDLLSECGVQLRLLMDENLTESFERRERIEGLVRGYIDQVGLKIEALSKEVVDNAYKTVGLLAGVAIAYLLKPEGGPAILLLGLGLYVGYVLFILFFYLRSLEQEHAARKAAFELQKTELQRTQLLTLDSQQRLQSVANQDQKLDDKLRSVRRIYWTLVGAAIVLFLAWFAVDSYFKTPKSVRNQALIQQAGRFKQFGYQDVRIDVEGWPMPAPLVDGRGRAMVPDLTAIRKSDRRLLLITWVPCETIGTPAGLQRLLEDHALAQQQKAEIQLLTEAVCKEEAGPDKLRSWLHGKLPGLRIWPR